MLTTVLYIIHQYIIHYILKLTLQCLVFTKKSYTPKPAAFRCRLFKYVRPFNGSQVWRVNTFNICDEIAKKKKKRRKKKKKKSDFI